MNETHRRLTVRRDNAEPTCTPAVAAVKPLKPELPDEGVSEIINALTRLDKTLWPAQNMWGDATATAIENLHHHLPALTNALYALESFRCDSDQLARMVSAINAAMPDFHSIMGAECDNAEPAQGAKVNSLHILAIALSLEFGQPTVTLTFVSPVAGTAYVDARCVDSASWQSGWVNSPCHAGTNTITMRAPCGTGALLKMRVKQ